MTSRTNPIPLRPDYSAVPRQSPSQALVRAAVATFLAGLESQRGAFQIAQELWPTDKATAQIITRAAVSPTTTGATQIALTALADFVTTLGPVSGGAELLRRATMLDLGGRGALNVPGLPTPAANVGFVLEAEPISVQQYAFTLTPKKFGVITVLTEELRNHSVPSMEKVMRQVLSESVALSLDGALFDANAASTSRPAGLLNNIAALVPSANGTPSEALQIDIRNLMGAVAPTAGNGPILIVAAPPQAVSLRLRLNPDAGFEVLASSALANGTVLAVAANALVSAFDTSPRIDLSNEATLHMEDTTPLAIGTAGSPNTIAAPTRSLFQTQSVGLRLIMEVSWALRVPGGLAWMQNVTW